MHHLLTHITGLDFALAVLLLIVYLWQGQAPRISTTGTAGDAQPRDPSPPTGQ
ncbi:MAG: hypothetical protein ACP5KN_02935 [Armatimonadota bacterium]